MHEPREAKGLRATPCTKGVKAFAFKNKLQVSIAYELGKPQLVLFQFIRLLYHFISHQTQSGSQKGTLTC